MSVQMKYIVYNPFFPFHEQHENDLKRLSILYMETNNCLWQHCSLLLYASLSRNVVLFALCIEKVVLFYPEQSYMNTH